MFYLYFIFKLYVVAEKVCGIFIKRSLNVQVEYCYQKHNKLYTEHISLLMKKPKGTLFQIGII